ncbi:MAG: hypothetical protein K2I00_01570 [Ruminococcus sp.]|nr:hypothetical protein [Ruminococcus sp.]
MPYISQLRQAMNELAHTIEETVKNGGIPAANIIDYVKRSAQDLIRIAHTKKEDVVNQLKNAIARDVVHPFEEIEETERKIQKVKADMESYETSKKHYEEQLQSDDYTLFNQYYDGYRLKKKKNKERPERVTNLNYSKEIYNIAAAESRNIMQRKRSGFLLSILITIACIILDTFMIYAPLSIGNVGDTLYVIFLSVSFALILDALPTGTGIIEAAIANTEKKIDLKNKAEIPCSSEKKELFRQWFSIHAMRIATVAFFIVYFLARVAMFLGGGDFNNGIQIFIAEESIIEKLRDVDFQFSDISCIIPLGSSILAYYISRTISVNDFSFVDTFNIKMKTVLNEYINHCSAEINKLNQESEALKQQKDNQMAVLWALYGLAHKTIPRKFTDFMMEVTAAAQKQAVSAYQGSYENFCRNARSQTEIEISTLTSKMASYSNTPEKVFQMSLPDESIEGLNYIWNMDGEQHKQTQEHIEDLKIYITKMLSKWEIKEDDSTDSVNPDDNNDDFEYNINNNKKESSVDFCINTDEINFQNSSSGKKRTNSRSRTLPQSTTSDYVPNIPPTWSDDDYDGSDF